MRQRNDDSSSIEGRESHLAYGDSFWANRDVTAKSSKPSPVTTSFNFHRRWFHPANFIIAASGDFDRDAMIAKLESFLPTGPFKGEIPPAIPTNTAFAKPGVYSEQGCQPGPRLHPAPRHDA